MKTYIILILILLVTPAHAAQKTFGNHEVESDLTVDTNTLYVDSTNNKVGVLTTSPGGVFDINNERIVVNVVADIQTAIDTLEAASGGTVSIMPGTYAVATGITIAGSVPIILEGFGRGATILAPATSVDTITVGGATNTNKSIVIRDLYINGLATDEGDGSDSGVGITLTNNSQATIERVRITEGVGGILIQTTDASGSQRYTFNNVLENVWIEKSEGYGVKILNNVNTDANFANSMKLSNSRIAHNGVGVQLTNGGTGATNGNLFINSWIETSTAGDVLVDLVDSDNNMFSNVLFDGQAGNDQITLDASSTNNTFITTLFDCDINDSGSDNKYVENEEVWVTGDYELQARATGDVSLFQDTDVADDANGKRLRIFRQAAEGDIAINIRNDAGMNSFIEANTSSLFVLDGNGDMSLQNNANANLEIFRQSSAGENRLMKLSGYITAATADKYISHQIDDTTDYYLVAREDSNILGVDIQMPLKTSSSRIADTTRVTTTYTVLVTDHHVFADTDGGAFTATLPAGVDGQVIKIMNTGTSSNLLTIAPNGADLLIGVNSNFTLYDGEALLIVYDSTEGWQ